MLEDISKLLDGVADAELLKEVMGNLSPQQVEQLAFISRAATAGRFFDTRGFEDFYYCLFGRELPPHTIAWVEKLFEAHAVEKGVLLEAWRGSTKSTLMMAFGLFIIGHRPYGSGLMVGANDTSAAKLSATMAALIEYSPGWRACFPTVVPDRERGWGERGYFVWDSDYARGATEGKTYDRWIEMCVADHLRDPSFVALGVHSGDIVGMHPSNFLLLDDIHNRENTISDKEIESVKGDLRANVLPTMSTEHKPFMGVAYTPWRENDAYEMLKASGSFYYISTPVYIETDGVKTFAWPTRWNEEITESWRHDVGSIEFARMFLLDLSAAKGASLKYYGYDSSLISYDLPMVGGADPTNVIKSRSNSRRSHFALAYVVKLPQGGAVVVDGVLEQCSEIEAEGYIAKAQSIFPNYLHTAIENVGGGALFIQVIRRNPSLKIVDSDLSGFLKKGGRIRSKRDRILIEMHPWFENGVVRVSTADTPFLNALRRLFENFYILDPESSPEFDVGDSVYHALKSIPDVLHIAPPEQALGTAPKSSDNPWNALGYKHG